MKTGLGFLPEEGRFPFLGLNTTSPRSMLKPGQAVVSNNLTSFRGTLNMRAGTTILGNGSTFETSVIRLFSTQDDRGVNVLIAFTQGRVCVYGSILGASSWVNITPTGQTQVTLPRVSAGNGWTASATPAVGIFVVQTTSLAVGQYIGSDATNFYIRVTSGVFDVTHTINFVNGSVIGNFTKSGSTTASTSSTTIGFNAASTTWWDVVRGTDLSLGDVVVFTNGIDPPCYWDFRASSATLVPVNLTGFCTAKAVAVFNNYFLLMNILSTTSGGKKNVLWSDTGDLTEWVARNAGEIDNMDLDGEILRALVFANNLIVFSSGTISSLYYVDSNVIFGQQGYVNKITLVGPGAVTQAGSSIYYLGVDNVYRWDGGRGVVTAGDDISATIKAIATSSSNYVSMAKLGYDQSANQLIVMLAVFTSIIVCTVLLGEVVDQTLVWSQLGDDARIMAIATHNDGNKPSLVWSNDSTVVVKKQVSGQTTDNGSAITINWYTGTFTVPQEYKSLYARWAEFECELSGSGTISVYYSVDETNYTLLGTITLSVVSAVSKLYFDTTSRQINFAFTGSPASFSLLWFKVWFRPGGPR